METDVNVWRILEAQGRRQGWLAHKLEISDAMLSHLKSGYRPWSEKQQERVAELLQVPVEIAFPERQDEQE